MPWGTPRRAPVTSLTPQQDRARDLTRVGTPSSASNTAVVPNGLMKWRASWSTTCGTTGTWRPVEARPATDGTSAWMRPTTTHNHGTMVQWLNKPLQAAQSPGQEQREENPSSSEEPPKEQRGHQPQDRPDDHHGGGSGYQDGGHEWSGPSAPQWGTDSRASTYGRADQRNGDPWQGGETQGPQGGRRDGEEPLLGDPWGAYKKSQQGPRETQRSNWSDQHWQRLPSPREEPNPVRQPGRRGPR